MTHSTVRRRSGVTRLAGVVAATALAGSGIVATSTVAVAEEAAPAIDQRDAAAFAAQASELPDGLIDAVSRDLGLSGEEYLANAATARSTSAAVDALKANGVDVNAAEIDGQDVTIYVAAEVDVEAAEATGATVVVGEPEKPDGLEQGEVQFTEDLRNGYGYANFPADGGQGGRCSIGFNGTGGNFLTAGHCASDLPEDSPASYLDIDGPLFDGPFPEDDMVPMGSTGVHNLGEGLDSGLVNVDAEAGPGWDQQPVASTWGGGTGGPTEGETVPVYDSTAPVVGQNVCKSGATSGWTCGEVLYAEDTLPVQGDDITFFAMNTCVLSGDSGGTILSGNYAVGVNSIGSVTDNSGCGEGQWNPTETYEEGGFIEPGHHFSGGYQINSGSQNAEADFGDAWDLMISVGTPSVTSPADGGEATPSFTFQGEVAAAEGATVTVNIDGVGDFEGTVDSDGTFSAEVEEPLELGEYTWTATASHTAATASEATVSGESSGSFTVVEPAVDELTVSEPGDDQTTSSTRPSFTGEGHPGAEVELTVGDESYGTATVNDDGEWTIEPDSDLPVAERFDAVITQTFEDDVQEVTVSNLGIQAAEATITVPEDGSEVGGDVVFEGTAHPGSDLSITLETGAGEADEETLSAQSAEVDTQDEGEETLNTWPGEWTFEGNAWTFTPEDPLDEGEYTVTVNATIGSDPDLGESSAASTFTVAGGGGGDAGGGDGDLPDTGTSTTPLIIGAILLLLGGGAAMITVRARRNGSAA